MWKDVIKLVEVTYTTNDVGDMVETKTETEVFARKGSVKRSEFYQAMATGLKPEVTFDIRDFEYNGQTKVIFEGLEYNVIRSYEKNGEIVELICNRLVGG